MEKEIDVDKELIIGIENTKRILKDGILLDVHDHSKMNPYLSKRYIKNKLLIQLKTMESLVNINSGECIKTCLNRGGVNCPECVRNYLHTDKYKKSPKPLKI